MTNFLPGETYSINYGTFSKLAYFRSSENGINYFRDISGLFGLSDSFISSGKVAITHFPQDDEF